MPLPRCPSSSSADVLRVDRFLHSIRLVKSRTLAQELVARGHVRIDGRRVVKPSEAVRSGNVLAVPLNGHVRVLRVLALPQRRGPAAEARACYEEIPPQSPIDGVLARS